GRTAVSGTSMCVSQAAHSTAAVAAATKCIFRIILLSFFVSLFHR
ncbi:hypothetical protein M084_4808, partial [Bacteroides fragilis str. 3988 T1]